MLETVKEHTEPSKAPGFRVQRVLFINPPSVSAEDFRVDFAEAARYWSYPPAGCAVLAAAVKRVGYEAQILDLNLVLLRTHNYKWIRLKALATIEDFAPDLICISVMFTMQHRIALDIAKRCKEWGYRVMMGGVHVTNAIEDVMRDAGDSVDYFGLYESERSLPVFLDYLNGKRGYDEVGQVIVNTPLPRYVTFSKRLTPEADDIPEPDYCGLALAEYEKVGQVGTYRFLRGRDRPAASALSNRGCRAKCTFCSVRYFNGPGVRKLDVEAVIAEIRHLYERDVRHITWLDDDLLFDSARAMRLFDGIANLKLDLTWDASNGLIAAAITEPLLDAMVASGCVGFNLGIESGSPEILRKVKKPGTVEKYLQCAELLKKHPQLFVKAFLILAVPGETLKQVKQTVDLCLKMGLDWHAIQLYQPLKSTELYRNMADQGFGEDGMSTDGRAFTAGVFSSLNQRTREERERTSAATFFDALSSDDLGRIPDKSELPDLWFLCDYKTNYEPIFGMDPGPKLDNKEKMLVDVCDRVTKDNPLGNYFLAVIADKKGDATERTQRMCMAMAYLNSSAYWQRRFEVLGIELG